MVRTTHGMLVRGVGRSLLRPLALAPLVLAFGAGAAPQSANPPQAQAQQATPPFQITVQRNLVVVGVVVRDAKGQAVGDLHREDFRLFDDGKPQEITSFAVEVSKPQPQATPAQAAPVAPASTTAVAPPPPAAAPPQRFVALFFDDLHATVDDYRRTRDAAGRYLTTTVRPQDHVAILTASGKNQVNFTGDQKKLHDALFRLAPRAHRSGGCPDIDEFEAYLVEKEHSSDALAVVHEEALQCTCGAGAGTSDETPSPMAERPAMMQPREGGQHGNCKAAAERDAELKATAVWSYAENQARSSLQALENSVSRLAAMPGQRSLVLVSTGFLTETQAEKVDAIINRALQKEVVISAIHSPGLEAPGGTADQTYPLPAKLEATKNTLKNIGSAYFTSALASLSSGTGGVFFYNNNDFDEGFRRAAAVPEVLYVLTFSPPELSLNGKFHSLKVTLNTHEHFTVQARRGYFASKTSLVAAAEFTRVISPAAVLTPTKPSPVRPPDEIAKPPVRTTLEPKIAPETFVDLRPDELAKQIHELENLTPADSQAMLPMILERVGATVEDFLDGFPNTACSERITSEVSNTAVDTTEFRASQSSIPLQHGAKFNYVALASPGHKEAPLTEYRTDTKGGPAQFRGAIVTSGFVSLLAHFRPAYQAESRFRYLGRELVKNQNTYVVAFAQRPGVARQAEQVRFMDKTGYVLLQGVAWIDPVSFAILRLRTEILQPELDLGLAKETTEVEYFGVTFKRGRKTLWLPREVNVSGQLERFAFSNQHHYSQYRLFIVEAEENRKKP